jgi:ABC-2 type transport system permease protein
MWNRIRALVAKEFIVIWKDKRSRVVIIVPPLIQLMVFGYAATFDVTHVRTVVFNEDNGLASRDLVARFEGSPTFDVIGHISSAAQIDEAIDSREASLVLRVGQTFSKDITSAQPASVQLIVDGRESNTALIIVGYASDVIADYSNDWASAHGEPAPPAKLVVRPWFNANLESRWFFVPGIVALLTMVVTMVVTALSVAREREVGTFEQLLVTPFRPMEILVGKSVPPMVIGVFEGAVVTTAAVFWFDIPLRGDPAVLLAGLLLYLLAVVGVGLMISAIARTQQQAILGAFLFLVPAVILSGFATPISNMPTAIQDLTLVNPMRYFLVIVRGVFLEGLPLEIVFSHLWPMAIIAVITLAGAAWMFRHRLS